MAAFADPDSPRTAVPASCCFGLLMVIAVLGCTEIECHDSDGDGHGEGCQAGPDCDDHDPSRVRVCDAEPPDCEAQPEAQGCPCVGSGSRACYLGPEGTRGVGSCRGGRHFCNQGHWTACDGLVLPGVESCNGQDDDCDGFADERVLSPCGGCDPDCTGEVWGGELAPFAGEAPLALTPVGSLTLARRSSEHMTVWVANTDEGTVSRIDGRRAVEEARYRVGPGTPFPERVAVDYVGDAWIVSQRVDGGSDLTKVAGAVERCVEAGQEPTTSMGPADVKPFGEDDCVILHVEISDEGAGSLAIDGTRGEGFVGGHPWIGLKSGRLLQVDGQTGERLEVVQLDDVVPHAAAFDALGHLWVLDRGGTLARVATGADGPEFDLFRSDLPCFMLESFAIDPGGLVFLTGFACENVVRFDPRLSQWDEVLTAGVLTTRGIALLPTEAWVVHTAGALSPVSRDSLDLGASHTLTFAEHAPLDSASVAVDGDGQLWVVSRVGGQRGAGVVTRFDPVTRAPSAEVTVGNGPRSQGDFTGNALAGSFEPEGAERHVFYGCGTDIRADNAASVATAWRRLHVVTELGSGARIELALRHGRDADALGAADFLVVGTMPEGQAPFDLDLPEGGLVELELRLFSAHHIGAPRVVQVGLEWECPGPQ